MNRNTEAHFKNLPSVDIPRSVFDLSCSHTTTLNTGDVVPLYWTEILPADSFRVQTSKVIRLQTLLAPVFSNMYFDTYWFFVPNRLLWRHWKEFCGENTTSAWAPSVEYSIPKIIPPEGGFASGTIADYLGIPVNTEFHSDGSNYSHYPMALPFRAYAMIMNEFFRDQNLSDPLNIPDSDSMVTGSNGDDYVVDVAKGGKPFKACKYSDYFTACLPSPQKGDAVSVPYTELAHKWTVMPGIGDQSLPETFHLDDYGGTYKTLGIYTGNHGADGYDFTMVSSTQPFANLNRGLSSGATVTVPFSYSNGSQMVVPTGHIDLSGVASTFKINDLRLAFQLQKMLEKEARSGSRYIEMIRSFFGVTSSDSRMQRPEYLGGNRIPIQIHQVTNTAQGENDFLGDLGAMSVTSDSHYDFEKSFEEHGILMCVGVARYDHLYSQGLSRKWTRNKFTDFFLPVFSNIGEQPVMSDEIFCDGNVPHVFGYNEAWSEYRVGTNMISAEMRPNIPNSLATWHFGDNYTECPTLSDGWIREDLTNVDRALSVTSKISNQLLMDCYFNISATRPLPMYSIPGLIDHN